MCLAEFNKICLQTALGFIVMGFIGFFVKLVFIVSFHRLTCHHLHLRLRLRDAPAQVVQATLLC